MHHWTRSALLCYKIPDFFSSLLEITAPMAATAMPRRIEIKGVAKPKIASVA
jgi:hypothetical protein